MFEEHKHPRDEQGKFVEKGQEGTKEYRQNTSYSEIINQNSDYSAQAKKGVKQARTEFAQVVDGWRPYGDRPAVGKYFMVKANTEELTNLLSTIYQNGGDYNLLKRLVIAGGYEETKQGLKYADEIAKMSYNEVLDYISFCEPILRKTAEEKENAINREKTEREALDNQKNNYINNIISTIGISSKNFDKIKEAFKYRESKEKELARLGNQLNYSQGGYVDNKKSVRAVKAELSGKYPASECAKMLGTTTKKIQDNLRPAEWHHSGGDMYNRINYYDISKLIDLQEDIDLANDSDYKESIELMKKLF